MSDAYLQLRRISFNGPKGDSSLEFTSGVNVVCGASDTGKSFLAESIDYMLGGSELREIPERAKYAEVELDLGISDGGSCRFRRATSGGNFNLIDLDAPGSTGIVLKQAHAHSKTDNLSGFLLEKIGLLGKRVLKSGAKATTRSLSFRDLARLVIVQEGEIQQRASPFWSGQYTTKTSELATVKLLLTGIDDSAVVAAGETGPDNTRQIALIDELLADLASEIEDSGADREELADQLGRLEISIASRRESLNLAQRELDGLLAQRREAFEERNGMQNRLGEIGDLLARFNLLREHYIVDTDRHNAIPESGSLFVHVDVKPCPVCGARPEDQHLESACDGDVDAVVLAANSEIQKIARLLAELNGTVSDLSDEKEELSKSIAKQHTRYRELDKAIQETVAPDVKGYQASFSELVEERARVQKLVDLFARREKLGGRRLSLQDGGESADGEEPVEAGIPDSVAHALSTKLSVILQAWNFPGECLVHFDKQSTDFIIDGKHRASRGKGLRAITHAAVNVALLEYCQEKGLSHPGFVVLDSPLLAYFKPEGPEDLALKGTDLKERFYEYLVTHHGEDSQVLIIENQHPPEGMENGLVMNVFTGNPDEGRFGLL
jgi:predicted nuclease with TOPRIM domain